MDEYDKEADPSPLLMTAAEVRMMALIHEQIKRDIRAREIEEIQDITNDEIIQIREILIWWMSFKALGKISTIAAVGLRWGGWLLGAYIAWKSGVLGSFLGSSGGKP